MNPRPLDEGLRPKSDNFEAEPTWCHFGGKINWFKPKKGVQKKVHDLKN